MRYILAILLTISTTLSFAGPLGGNCEADEFGRVTCGQPKDGWGR